MKRWRSIWALLLQAGFALAAPAAVADVLGVVLIHGKEGVAEQFASYDAPLAERGILHDRPEMCWSRRRIYDRPYLDCLSEIDAAIDRLKARGATAVVVGGQSLGANGAIGYGARRKDLKGVIGVAPAHGPELLAERPEIAQGMAKARAMVAAGRGDDKATFTDINAGRKFTVTTTSKIYLSFFGADSAAVMPVNTKRLTAPLLCVAGSADQTQRGPGYVFAQAPKNPLNRYVTVTSDHLGTPAAARDVVIKWLRELAGP